MTLAAVAALYALPAAAATYGVTPIMGFSGPEDLALTPDGAAILASSMYREGQSPGGLMRLDLATQSPKLLPMQTAKTAGWGDASCAAPPAHIGSHGIHLSKRADGKWQLLVVNHAERESVEFLEIIDGGKAAVWRGCAPTDEAFNDVVATPEGGFIASVPVLKAVRAANGGVSPLDGRDTGYLVEWRRGRGPAKLPGTDTPFSNGVEISADGRTLYYNAYIPREVRRYDRRSGKETGRIKLDYRPDNLTWDKGQLIDAGIFETTPNGCPQVDGVCARGFVISRIDPATFTATQLYQAAPGVMAGVATALQVGDSFYVGGFLGARMLKLVPEAETAK